MKHAVCTLGQGLLVKNLLVFLGMPTLRLEFELFFSFKKMIWNLSKRSKEKTTETKKEVQDADVNFQLAPALTFDFRFFFLFSFITVEIPIPERKN